MPWHFEFCGSSKISGKSVDSYFSVSARTPRVPDFTAYTKAVLLEVLPQMSVNMPALYHNFH